MHRKFKKRGKLPEHRADKPSLEEELLKEKVKQLQQIVL